MPAASRLVPLAKGGTLVAAALVGINLGVAVDRQLGVDVDGGLCSGAPNPAYSITNGLLAAVTLTDCDKWRADAAFVAQANSETNRNGNPAAIGSESCSLDGTACAHIYAVSADGSRYCIVRTQSAGYDLYDRVPLGQFENFGTNWWGGWPYVDGPTLAPSSQCPPSGFGSAAVSAISVSINGRSGPSISRWSLSWSGVGADGVGGVDLPISEHENAQRTFRCDVTLSNGSVVSEFSEPFDEGDGVLPKVECPAMQAGWTAETISIYETLGNSDTLLGSTPTTASYRGWKNDYPECSTGACLLELKSDNVSCFELGSDCDGWVTYPGGPTTYTCFYGTHAVPLSWCYVYGPTFSPLNQQSGHAYGDPVTGATLDAPTSPTAVDILTSQLLEAHWVAPWVSSTGKHELSTGDEIYTARVVATQCVALGVTEECADLPIFSPGNNVNEAAVHDLDAIQGNSPVEGSTPKPVLLQYVSTQEKLDDGFQRRWYINTPPCVVGTYDSSVQQCDEYPFFTTEEGAKPDAGLRPIKTEDNASEGTYLGAFITLCGLDDHPRLDPGRYYLVIPTPDLTVTLVPAPTPVWCNPS